VANLITGRATSAVFFTLDNVVRRIKPERQAFYKETTGSVPPTPCKPGDQEIIESVVKWIVARCAATNSIAIGLDMAPYIGQGHASIDGYQVITDELILMLKKCGMPLVEVFTCPHVAKEEPVYDQSGRIVHTDFLPLCECRFPERKLVEMACAIHKVRVFKDVNKFRVLGESILVGVDEDARQCSIFKCGMDWQHAEAIKNGSVEYKNLITHSPTSRSMPPCCRPNSTSRHSRGRSNDGERESHDGTRGPVGD
jgi:histidinol phosphatase-like enzyme